MGVQIPFPSLILNRKLPLTQCAGAYFRLDELSQEVGWYRWWSPGQLWKPPPKFGQITEFGFFEEINFFVFLSP